jgi:hypothetical protein
LKNFKVEQFSESIQWALSWATAAFKYALSKPKCGVRTTAGRDGFILDLARRNIKAMETALPEQPICLLAQLTDNNATVRVALVLGMFLEAIGLLLE